MIVSHQRLVTSIKGIAVSLMVMNIISCSNVINESKKPAATFVLNGIEEGAPVMKLPDNKNLQFEAAVALEKDHLNKAAKWKAKYRAFAKGLDFYPSLSTKEKLTADKVPLASVGKDIQIGVLKVGAEDASEGTFGYLRKKINGTAEKAPTGVDEKNHFTVLKLARDYKDPMPTYKAEAADSSWGEGMSWPPDGLSHLHSVVLQTNAIEQMKALSEDEKGVAIHMPNDLLGDSQPESMAGHCANPDGFVVDISKAFTFDWIPDELDNADAKPDGRQMQIKIIFSSGPVITRIVVDDGQYISEKGMFFRTNAKMKDPEPAIAAGVKEHIDVYFERTYGYSRGNGAIYTAQVSKCEGYAENPKPEEPAKK